MSNTLDEILDDSILKMKLSVTPQAIAIKLRQQIQDYYLAEVLDMIGEDKNPDRADHAADKFRIMGINLAKKFIREAAKERFK